MQLIKHYPLLLGSSSPQRLALLQQIGIEPDLVCPPKIDETPLKREKSRVYVERIAREKAEFLSGEYKNQNYAILTGDTIVSVGTRIIGKAETKEEAFKTIQFLSSRSPKIYTAVALYHPKMEKILTRLSISKVKIAPIPDRMIHYFLESYPEQWQGKAGCFSIGGFMQIYIRSINGCYSNIVGYPLREVYNLLQGTGVIGFVN